MITLPSTLGLCGISHQVASAAINRYVITLRNGVPIEDRLRRLLESSKTGSLQEMEPGFPVGVQKFSFPKLRVFAGRFDTQAVAQLRAHPAL